MKRMKLQVRGDVIEVSPYVIARVPLLTVLAETKSEEPIKEPIELDSVSPKFLSYIIEFIKNQETTSSLKTALTKTFEEATIIESLKYLSMDKLLASLYDPCFLIKGYPVIMSFSLNRCKMLDGQSLHPGDIDLTHTWIFLNPVVFLLVARKNSYSDILELEFIDQGSHNFVTKELHESWFVNENRKYYLRAAIYCALGLPGSFVFCE
jgi:hypothetical protein